MSYELEGKLIVKEETVQITDKFKKREFVVEQEENNNGQVWIQQIKLQAIQDKVSILDNVNVGDSVKVSFNIQGKGHEKNGETRYFNNLTSWKVERLGNVTPENTKVEESKEDLPF